MSTIVDAYPELDRVREFFPLGVETPSQLSRQQIEQYNEKGYIFPLDVFSAAEIAVHRTYFDDLLPKALAAGWNSYEITNWHKHCAGVWDLVTDGRILDYVQDLLGNADYSPQPLLCQIARRWQAGKLASRCFLLAAVAF